MIIMTIFNCLHEVQIMKMHYGFKTSKQKTTEDAGSS